MSKGLLWKTCLGGVLKLGDCKLQLVRLSQCLAGEVRLVRPYRRGVSLTISSIF